MLIIHKLTTNEIVQSSKTWNRNDALSKPQQKETKSKKSVVAVQCMISVILWPMYKHTYNFELNVFFSKLSPYWFQSIKMWEENITTLLLILQMGSGHI